MLTDRALVRKSKEGDLVAFEQLVKRYQDRIYNLSYRMTGSPEDARDMTQEAFLRAYQSLSGFREGSSFSTWLYRLASNVCLDELRRKSRRPLLVVDQTIDTGDGELVREVPDESAGPQELLVEKELAKELEEALLALTPAHRLMIILRDINELSYQEIANTTNLPLGTVKSRINRARQALRYEAIRRELLPGLGRLSR